MRIVIFCHSLVSDWNHGNAHFLRGVARELMTRGHQVRVYEPAGAWSRRNLLAEHGRAPIREYHRMHPGLRSRRYRLDRLDLDRALDGADLVLVHEWNDPALISRLGTHRAATGRYRLFFHDTHHRSATSPDAIAALDLSGYDGVLAFGEAVRDRYVRAGWARRAWVWHEAADVHVFRPLLPGAAAPVADVVWIGNWGDDERTAELSEYFVDPVRELRLRATAHGVRYPEAGRDMLARAGIEYAGWLANFRVPDVFARHRLTLHIPRRPYLEALSGIPTIRVFEALACGIPLICARWRDTEGLFREGEDFLVAGDGREMRRHLRAVLNDEALARSLAASGLATIRREHTCAQRVDELLGIRADLEAEPGVAAQRQRLRA